MRSAWERFQRDTDHYEEMERHFQNFRRYLNRNAQIAKGGRTEYQNLLNALGLLTEWRLILPRDRRPKQELIDQINSYPRLAVKKWLLEKVAEL